MPSQKPKKSEAIASEGKHTAPFIMIKQLLGFSDDPDATWRLFSVLSFFLILIVLGIPIWWYTTRVYRASLPLNKMYNLKISNKTNKPFGIPLSLEYDVLITVVNPEPEELNVDLDGEVIDANLQPFLKNVSSIADFVVKSQWLYLVELGAIPRKVDDHYALLEVQLPHVITPLEKKLWSHLSPRPCINLVLYFAHCRAPLYIYKKLTNNKNEISETNAFLSPRWGGIYIINADKESCERRNYKPNIQDIVSTFVTQLQQLLYMDGRSEDDFYELKMRKTLEMLDSTSRTLKSLAQLLSEINSIVISDKVADKINTAVKYAELAQENLLKNDVDEALKCAKVSFENSEGAFGDSSLLALLYFPDDQKQVLRNKLICLLNVFFQICCLHSSISTSNDSSFNVANGSKKMASKS